MNATVEIIKQLRSETGAGVMECRKAFDQAGHDYQKALACLHENAALKAAKRAERIAVEGKIELYSHNNGRIGVMVEINTETEFASRSEAFRRFSSEVALQITAAAPLYVRDENIPQAVLDGQRQDAVEKARLAGKPERVIEKIVVGVLDKYKDSCVLLRQPYIRDESITVAQLLDQAAAQIGENVVIRRFARWEICPEKNVSAG